MKAAVLERFGETLSIRELPDPEPGAGQVVVDVAAAGVLPYAKEVFDGTRRYLLGVPVVPGPGAVGRVRAVGPDATRLKVGDWVTCDPTIRARDDASTPDITLHGWSARGEGGIRLQQAYPDGAFAERMLVPAENAHHIGTIAPGEAGLWCTLNLLLVPYGGLLAGEFSPGETLLVSGATGNFGSAAVAVAVAMGASRVVCPGRDRTMLEELARRFGARVRTVRLTGEQEGDGRAMADAAEGPIDVVLDLLPPFAGSQVVRTAVMTVGGRGRVVLMGGVGMLGGDDLRLPYTWLMRNGITVRGQWMYPRDANPKLIDLVRSGLLDLGLCAVTSFPLEQVNEAVEHAAIHSGPFRRTILCP